MGVDYQKIRRLREAKALSQAAAAIAAGISTSETSARQAWNRIESGRHVNLTVSTLEAIASVLGVKAKDLLK